MRLTFQSVIEEIVCGEQTGIRRDESEEASLSMGNLPQVVSREEWLAARKKLLEEEKELTRARDRVNADRRRLPMVRVDKPYTFEGPNGKVGLLDLFEGRLQLVMHHFMWLFDIDPDGNEIPRDDTCSSCSSAADCVPQRLTQLHIRNTTLVAVSRAPYPKIAAYRQRMGWTFPWYSSAGSEFNYDFHATVDDRVAPVLLDFRTEAELAGAGSPGPRVCVATGRASAPSCASGTRCTTPTPRSVAASTCSARRLAFWATTSTSPRSAAKRNGKNPKDARLRSASRPAAPTCASPTNTTMPNIPQELASRAGDTAPET